MFGTHRFKNPYDPDDDGRDLEITPEEEAASDDEGRAEAEVLLGQMGAKERNQNDRNFRRWLLRLAKKALAEGAERRRIARKKEKARAAAEAEAARQAEENARKAEKSKRAFERYCRESDERWARIDEETRAANAAWAADWPARRAAERAAMARTPTATLNAASAAKEVGLPRGDQGPLISTALPASPSWTATALAAPPPERAGTGPSASGPLLPAQPDAVSRPAPPKTPTSTPTGQTHRDSPSLIKLSPSTRFPALPAQPAASAPAAAAPPHRSTAAPASPARPRPSLASVARPPTPARMAITSPPPSQPLPPPPPPAAPAAPEPPPFTGADLATYRATVGLSQTALAERLGTTQGTVSKAEGTPTALLGPTLRRAMWEAQRGAGGETSR